MPRLEEQATLCVDNVFQLPDGRRLGYAEYGDPSGDPIFLLHGNPGSRLFWGLFPGSPFRSNVRIIAPDRPGYGLTDFRPNRTVADWPEDVAALADALGIDRFAMFGPSGGGPYALACAWKIPERLISVGVFGSVGPNVPSATKGIIPSLRLLFRLAPHLPWLVRAQMGLVAFLASHFLSLYVRLIFTELTEEDKAIYLRLGLRDLLRPDRAQAFRQGGKGSAYDVTVPGLWPIPLEQINMKVHLWQGEADRSVGRMGRYLADMLPNCEARFIPDTGHFWIFEHMKEVLEALVPQAET